MYIHICYKTRIVNFSLQNGKIVGIGKAGNPDIMAEVTPVRFIPHILVALIFI